MPTINDLRQQAATIKNATQVGENTATRVGTTFETIADLLEGANVGQGVPSVDLSQLNALRTPTDQTTANPTIYNVTTMHNLSSTTIKVGTLFIFSDAGRAVVTQILLSNYQVDGGGNISSPNTSQITMYYRMFNIVQETWSAWTLYAGGGGGGTIDPYPVSGSDNAVASNGVFEGLQKAAPEVDINDIDDLDDYVNMQTGEASTYTIKAYHNLSSTWLRVGVLMVFANQANNTLTQICISNCMVDGGGNLIPNHTTNVMNVFYRFKQFSGNPPEGMTIGVWTTWAKFGDSGYQPDNEDIDLNASDQLQFANKLHDASAFSGLGRVYLRKNIITSGGVEKNVLTQAMMNTANTIYHIQYDYDLNGQTITLPAGCVLKFDGGIVKNGTLVGSGTKIIASDGKIFDTMTFGGSFIGAMNALWIGATPNDQSFDNAVILRKWINEYSGIFNTIEFPESDYYFLTPTAMSGDLRNRKIDGCGSNFYVNIPDDGNGDGQTFLKITGESFTLQNVNISNARKTIVNDTEYNLTKTCCLEFNEAQLFTLHEVAIYYFDKAITLIDVWYGGFSGRASLMSNRICIFATRGDSAEINTIDFSNVRCRGVSVEAAQAVWAQESGESADNYALRIASCGVDFHCLSNDCKFNGMVIEGFDYGIRFNYTPRASIGRQDALLNIQSCYFEANRTYDIYIGRGYVINPNNLSNLLYMTPKVVIIGCLFHTLKKVYMDNSYTIMLGCADRCVVTLASSYILSSLLHDDGSAKCSDKTAHCITRNELVYNPSGVYGGSFGNMRDFLQAFLGNSSVIDVLADKYPVTTTLTNNNKWIGRITNQYSFGITPDVRLQDIILPLHSFYDRTRNEMYVEVESGGCARKALASYASVVRTSILADGNSIPLYEFLRRWDAGVAYTGKVDNLFLTTIIADPSTGLITNEGGTIVGFGKKAILAGTNPTTIGSYVDVDSLCMITYSFYYNQLSTDLVQCGRNYNEILPAVNTNVTKRQYLGQTSGRTNPLPRINAIYCNKTTEQYEIYNGFEWVPLINRSQRYVYKESGKSISERATMADFDGQKFYNKATGIIYTFFVNEAHTSYGWRTSVGRVESLEHPNGYDATSNPLDYLTEMNIGECVNYNDDILVLSTKRQQELQITAAVRVSSSTPSRASHANTLQGGKRYWVGYSIKQSWGGRMIFRKTSSVEATDTDEIVILPNFNETAQGREFVAPDPSEYPYIFVENSYSLAEVLTFEIYVPRWVKQDGATYGVLRRGATADRPASDDIYVGFEYFDETLGKSIYWNGIQWIDGTGVPIASSLKVLSITQTDYDALTTKDSGTLYVITA